jgi:predicted deacylase
MTAPLRDDFDIAYHDIGPSEPTPRVALVAGIHGNELNGVFVLARLAAYLRGVAQAQHAGQTLRRRVVIVPAVNVLGINTQTRVWPFDKTDINRMFPGYSGGETTQRIAGAVLELTAPARYRVDIHSSNIDFEELPQVRLYEPTADERQTALRFGLPAVIERRMDKVFTSTIGHAWRQCQGENFVVQVGRAGTLQPGHCERLFLGLVAFLVRADILTGVELALEEEAHYFGIRQSCPLIAERAGMFVSKVEVGHWLQAGAVIGQIYDGFDGELREEVRAPVAGMLTGIRRQPLLYQGNLIARLQTKGEMDAPVEMELQGLGQ